MLISWDLKAPFHAVLSTVFLVASGLLPWYKYNNTVCSVLI